MRRKHLVIATTFLGLATVAHANHPPRGPEAAQQTTEELVYSLQQVSASANDIARDLSYGGRGRPDLWYDISSTANSLARGVRFQVGRSLRHRGGFEEAKRGLASLEWDFRKLFQLVNDTRRPPSSFLSSVDQVQSLKFELEQQLRRGGGGNGRYVGQCEVVLETLWGSDIQKFYATATADTKHQALAFARQEAQDQCLRNRRGALSKCTVNSGNCFATPAGGGRRGGEGPIIYPPPGRGPGQPGNPGRGGNGGGGGHGGGHGH